MQTTDPLLPPGIKIEETKMNLNYQKFGMQKGLSFFFPMDRQTLAATIGVTAQTSIVLPSDTFMVVEVCGKATDGDNLTVKWELSEGEILMESPVVFNTVVGTGQLPFVLPEPFDLAPKSVVRIYFTNLVATAQTIDLTFIGKKIKG